MILPEHCILAHCC